MRQASSHQRNVGMLPRFLPHSRSLLRVGFGECGNRATSPQTAIVLASLSSSALFSASQAGERLRYNACPTPSQLSCHWLHMKKNETSSETRLQKKKGGGFSVKRKCSKGGRKLWNKKDRGFCLLLSVAIIFGEVCGSAFLVSVSGAGEDLG